MTKTIKICDKCNKEVEWLYPVPTIWIEGLNLTIKEGHKVELCKDCMRDLINIIDKFHKTK
jgi:hypothetical protein